eukprot:1159536-Pelagomonas_calceolata.AAC.2
MHEQPPCHSQEVFSGTEHKKKSPVHKTKYSVLQGFRKVRQHHINASAVPVKFRGRRRWQGRSGDYLAVISAKEKETLADHTCCVRKGMASSLSSSAETHHPSVLWVHACSLRTPLCVLYKSEVVASGAIFYAARKLQVRSEHPALQSSFPISRACACAPAARACTCASAARACPSPWASSAAALCVPPLHAVAAPCCRDAVPAKDTCTSPPLRLGLPQICLPESVPWWAAFSVKTEQLVAVVRTLYELYQKPKATYINVSQEALQPARKVSVRVRACGLEPSGACVEIFSSVPSCSWSRLSACLLRSAFGNLMLPESKAHRGERLQGLRRCMLCAFVMMCSPVSSRLEDGDELNW